MMANILIDTEVFASQAFDFERDVFKTLDGLVNKDRVKVLITSVIDREVIADLRKLSEDAQKAIRKTLKEHSFLRHSTKVPFNELSKKDALADLTDVVLKQWDDWKDRNAVDVLSSDDVDAEVILESYFDKRPPFGTGGKKLEFPDAFSLEAAKQWCVNNDEQMTVISRDKGLAKFCEANSDCFEHVETLAETLEPFSDKAIIARLHSGFEAMKGDFIEYIGNEFESRAFTAYEYDGEVNNVDVQSVDLGDLHIIEAKDGSGAAEFEVTVSYKADVNYDDPDSGMWDSEDKQMIMVERASTEVEEEITETVHLEFTYNEDDPKEIQLDRVTFSGDDIDIDLSRYLYPEDH
jgi:hypothetical protein